MGNVIQLQNDWSRAFIRDISRHQLPLNAVWKSLDWVPNIMGAPYRRRNGFTHVGPAVAGSYGTACAVAPFKAGKQRLQWNDAPHLFRIDDAATAVDLGAATLPVQKPIFYRDKLYIPAGSDGASHPQVYDGVNPPADLAGAPDGLYGCVFLDHLILGGSVADPYKFYVAAPGDPTSWDLVNSWYTVHRPMTGAAPIREGFIVFSKDLVTRFLGTEPSNATSPGNLIEKEIWQEGCIDARSICFYGDQVIHAHGTDIYMTDGYNRSELTLEGGINEYWQELMAGYQDNWTVACGVLGQVLFVTVADETTELFSAGCYLPRRTWFPATNIHAHMFAEDTGAAQGLLFTRRNATHLCDAAPMIRSDVETGHDDDGTAILPVLETRSYQFSEGLKVFRELITNYSCDGAELQVDAILGLSAATEKTLSPNLPSLAAADRKKRSIRTEQDAVAFRLTQLAESTKTCLYGLSAEIEAQDPAKVRVS